MDNTNQGNWDFLGGGQGAWILQADNANNVWEEEAQAQMLDEIHEFRTPPRDMEARAERNNARLMGVRNAGRKSRYWCFTLNNYDEGDIATLRNIMDGSALVSYLVFGREVGENGTPHLQGYVEFTTRWDLRRCQRSFLMGAHFEQRRGTPQEASDYCKKDGDWEEVGTLSRVTQGTLRRRLININ